MKIKNNFLAFGLLAIILLGLSFVLHQAQAQSIINPNTSAYNNGNYSLKDIMLVVVGIARIILGFVGSLALVMFVYGGILFLISGGSSDKVGQAKKIIVAAVVGLLIVFASYMIVSFVLGALGLSWEGTDKEMKPAAEIISSSRFS